MATYEELSFTYATLKIIDDTATPIEHELVLRDGDVSISNLKAPYLNESVNTQSNGQHRSTVPGERIYPEISLSARVDEMAASNSLLDVFAETTGSSFASATNADSNSPVPHRHITIEYARPVSSDVQSLSLESVDATMEISDSQSVTISLTGTVKGRAFANGALIAREYGGAASIPSWVPAAP